MTPVPNIRSGSSVCTVSSFLTFQESPREASPTSSSNSDPPSREDGSGSCFDSEEERLMLKSGMDRLEIKEWRMELRENELSMEEGNMKAKRMKLKELEDTFDEQQSKRQEEQNVIDEKQRNIDVKEAEVVQEKEDLRRLKFELNEKNAIMEIILKMNNKTEKIAVNFSDLSSSSSLSSGSNTEAETAGNDSSADQQEMMNMLREQARILEVILLFSKSLHDYYFAAFENFCMIFNFLVII